MSTVAGADSGTCTTSESQDPKTMCLSFPIGIAVNAQLNFYISEAGNNKIKFVDLTSNTMYTIIGTQAAE
jgi:hypothetical protein